MYPFERFAERAKKTLALAQEEAERSHHSYIGTEHLLLGLLRQPEGDAAEVLKQLEIDVASVRQTIATVLGRNERIIIQQTIPTSRVKMVIEIAFEEARRAGHEMVDTGHLLMALVIEGEGIAAHVLEDLGADAKTVIAALEKRWGQKPSGRGKRPAVRLPFPPPPIGGWRKMRILAGGPPVVLPAESPAESLQVLLRHPDAAALLKSRGLDIDRLTRELMKPPENVSKLRQELSLAKAQLNDAASSSDYARAAQVQKGVESLSKKLQRAEADWLKSLGA